MNNGTCQQNRDSAEGYNQRRAVFSRRPCKFSDQRAIACRDELQVETPRIAGIEFVAAGELSVVSFFRVPDAQRSRPHILHAACSAAIDVAGLRRYVEGEYSFGLERFCMKMSGEQNRGKHNTRQPVPGVVFR